MTKADVKALCETDGQLQWWAMVLFAEISELAGTHSGYRDDDKLIASCVRSKVDEFPRLVIQRALEKAKDTTED